MRPNEKKLVDALRSGEFTQAKNQLYSNGSYCCLGVACEIFRREYPEWEWSGSERSKEFRSEHERSVMRLPFAVRDWLGWQTTSGVLKDEYSHRKHGANSLMRLNDNGKSFDYIADVIENGEVL